MSILHRQISDYIKLTGDKADVLDKINDIVQDARQGIGCQACHFAKIEEALVNAYRSYGFDYEQALYAIEHGLCEDHAQQAKQQSEAQLLENTGDQWV